jgi:hypothetical protein
VFAEVYIATQAEPSVNYAGRGKSPPRK